MNNQNLKARRIALHNLLVEILGSDHVYFQPPESLKMVYPAIVYERNDLPVLNADNEKYLRNAQYRITVIDPSPDSLVVDKLSKLKFAKFNRHFATNGLNHDVFLVYWY